MTRVPNIEILAVVILIGFLLIMAIGLRVWVSHTQNRVVYEICVDQNWSGGVFIDYWPISCAELKESLETTGYYNPVPDP